MERIDHIPYEEFFRQVGRIADELGIKAYTVGGFVRDLFLDRKTNDIDFVTVGAGTGLLLAEKLAHELYGGVVHTYPNFGTAALRAKFGDEELVLEFVGARRESYRSSSRKPVVEEGTLEDDQRRRDFTINALALAINSYDFGELIDPFDGKNDLERKVIRTPLDPERTFSDDPLRMMRAARFAAQLSFRIEKETHDAIRRKASRIRIVSQERITDELQKIMITPRPSVGFKVLYESGLLKIIFPELAALAGAETMEGYGHKDNFYHSLQVLDNLCMMTADRPPEKTLWLRWAALLHDIAKPRTKRFSKKTGWTFHGHEDRGTRMIPGIFRKLRMPTDERMRYVQKLVRLHHRPVALVDEEVTDSAVRRLLFEAGDTIDDLMTLVRADITSRNPQRVQRYLDHFDQVDGKMVDVEEKDRLRNFRPPVDGHEIMETLGLPPGPEVGKIKNAIEEAILDGRIPNEHDAAFRFMMEIKNDVLAESQAR